MSRHMLAFRESTLSVQEEHLEPDAVAFPMRRCCLVKKGDWLKVLERHKVLTLARERRITQRQAAKELARISHIKLGA